MSERIDKMNLFENELFLHFKSREYLYRRDVFSAFLNVVTNMTESKIGYLHLVNEDAQEIELAVWSDEVFRQCTTAYASHYPVSEAGIWAESIRQRRPVLHNNYQTLSSKMKQGLPEGHFPVSSHLGIPVFSSEKIVAVLGIGNRETPYEDLEVSELNSFIQDAWLAVCNKIDSIEKRESERLLEYKSTERESSLMKVIAAMSDALELRDEYTSAHQKNVSVISNKIAKLLDLDDRQIEGLTIGALVHDIGKIGVPTQILNKMKPLTSAEFEIIKQHAHAGAMLFKNIALPMPLFEMIEQHHERLDGTGYPKGLKGEDICIEARIIAVADTFDAMASDRPYRYSPGRDEAIKELKSNRNTKYDPYVVDRFLELLESDPDLKPGGIYK